MQKLLDALRKIAEELESELAATTL